MPPSRSAEAVEDRADAPVPGVADAAVATRALTKRFGAQAAVDGIDLRVPHGAVYGFLGPNGSGKTTTIRMLLGLVRPSAGEVEVLGGAMPRDGGRVLPRVGALVEGPAFHLHLSGRANLARLDAADVQADPRTTRRRIDAALDRVGLLAAAGKRYRAYSLGMRQRLGLAAALLRPRDLLVLDEPTNGLDPQGTREVRTLIGSLAAEGATILVSSHLLSEIEQVCTHLGVLHAGRLVAQGTLEEVRGGSAPRVRLVTPDVEAALAALTDAGASGRRGEEGEVLVEPGDLAPEAVVARLVAAGVRVREFAPLRSGLEDRFIALTGEGFDVRA